MNKLYKSIACLLVLLATFTNGNAQNKLMHYWHFNTYSGSMYTDTIRVKSDYTFYDTNKVRIVYGKQTGVSPAYTTYADFANPVTADYDTVNQRLGAAVGRFFRVRNPSDSMQMLLYIPSVNYTHLLLQFGTENSSLASGMLHQYYDYSVDSGATWRTSGLSRTSDSAWLAFHRTAISLATDSMTRNNPKLVFRIRFGANNTGGSGNNRFDNVTLEGDTINTSTITIASSPAGAICAGTSVHFTVTSTAADTTVIPYYHWYVNNVAAGTNSTGFTTATLNNGDMVKCVLTDSMDGAVLAVSNSITTSIIAPPSAGIITGGSIVCPSATLTLTDTTSGGTWHATNGSATVSASGVVTGVAPGLDTVFYTVANMCGADTALVTITIPGAPVAGTISGPSSICAGMPVTLSETVTGGTWSITNSNATITPAGAVNGIVAGTDTVVYTVTGCGSVSAFYPISIFTAPHAGVISGPSSLCAGTSAIFASTISGGTFSSSSTTATTSADTVRAVSAGTATISYGITNVCGSDYATHSLTVLPQPNAGTITGSTNVCPSSSVTLSDTTTGGTWHTANGNATISAAGVVTGITPGNDTVYYTLSNSCGTDSAMFLVIVSTIPSPGTISGADTVCTSATITLLPTVSGGTWSITNSHATISAAGVVTGVSTGIDTVVYTVTTCGTASTSFPIYVNTLLASGIINIPASLCVDSMTLISADVLGGVWSLSNAGATLATDTLTGVTAGSVTISYTVTNGCGSNTTTAPLMVVAPINAGTIAGPDSVCEGSTITLAGSVAGGTWTATNGNATISTIGLVTAVTSGLDTINYSFANVCGTSSVQHVVYVRSAASCVNGIEQVAGTQGNFKVFPNPSNGAFAVLYTAAGNEAIAITITDAMGRKVKEVTIEANKQTAIEIDAPYGIYLLNATSGSNKYTVQVTIVR